MLLTLFIFFRGHTSYITHFDFGLQLAKEEGLSKSGKKVINVVTGSEREVTVEDILIQSNCGAYDLLFWSCSDGKRISASKARDISWTTWTCTLEWPVQGIWPKGADGTDINTVARSHCFQLVPF